MARRKHDQYFTPEKAIKQMFEVVGDTLQGIILEPCFGGGAFANVLRNEGLEVLTNDIDPNIPALKNMDAATKEFWAEYAFIDWTITNPPFSKAIEILQYAYEYSSCGVIMYLRLSFLEPCRNRCDFLVKHPPTQLICCPRISFTRDGKTDNVTGAWFIWEKRKESLNNPIRVLPKN